MNVPGVRRARAMEPTLEETLMMRGSNRSRSVGLSDDEDEDGEDDLSRRGMNASMTMATPATLTLKVRTRWARVTVLGSLLSRSRMMPAALLMRTVFVLFSYVILCAYMIFYIACILI